MSYYSFLLKTLRFLKWNFTLIKEWQKSLKVFLTYGGIHRGPACFQRWCVPCWWFLEESPRLHWSSPTGRSAWREEDKIDLFIYIYKKQPNSPTGFRYISKFCVNRCCTTLACWTYIHALPQVSHVGFFCLNQLCHDEPRHTHTKHTITKLATVILSSSTEW